jgi:hypothetical protein
MSVDPAAAAAASTTAAVDAIITAELNALAADAQALGQQVSVGDVVPATVLPSNGLTDLLSILGNRVAASLPPTLTPGDQITVQVTGFNGTQILLRVLAASEQAAPSTAAPIPLPVSDPPAGTASASLPGSAAAAPPSSPPPPPGLASGSVAPPAAAFVAASIRPNAPVPPPILPGQAAVEPPPDGPPGTIPGAPGTTLPAPVFGGIEARLAAARAAAVQLAAPTPPVSPAPAAAAGIAARAVAPRPTVAPVVPPPPAAPPSPPAAAASPRGIAAPPPLVTTRFPATAPPPTAGGAVATAAPTVRPLAAYADPLALVRALKLPVTPTNLAAAKLALETPQRLPAALATLESALPQSDDPRVATLRTISAFIGKIEPSSPQLATQIASYVEHVVAGSEPQLAQLLRAYAGDAPVPATPAAATPSASDEPPATTVPDAATGEHALATAASAPAAAATDAAGEAALPVVALAQVAERAATLAVSLKQQIFALVSGPAPAGHASDVLAPAAASALSAVTAVQLAAAQAASANPQTMSFTLPLWLGSGGYAQAQLAVDRDAPDTPNVPLDGDNFHIAFILETKHLGTVAIDLRTVGRAFALSVKTESLRTAQRFGDELSRLTDRLSSLRYQPRSVEAVVAPHAGTPAPAPVIAVPTEVAARPSTLEFNERA